MDVQHNITQYFSHWTEDLDGYIGVAFQNIYPGIVPQAYSLRFGEDMKLEYSAYEFRDNMKSSKANINFSLSDTLKKFKELRSVICVPISACESYIIGADAGKNFIMSFCADSAHSQQTTIELFTSRIDVFMKEYAGCFVAKDRSDNAAEFGIAAVSDGQIYTCWYDLKEKYKVDVKKNYNDDLPYNSICKILQDDSRADLMLFYGEPGTGKSSLIKHLITQFPDTQFIFLDANILQSVQPAKFITYLTENERTVLVLEDCEKILASRDNTFGMSDGVMSTLLNITDGIISDILGIKLICTFNTSLSNIDKALLRKGRLTLKYEFRKLSKDKAQDILADADADMTLADLYYQEENDFSKAKRNKIGFN